MNLIDTSVSYSRGRCHQIVGDSLKKLKLRDDFLIATKIGGIANDNDPPEDRGYSRRNIIRQCELSLAQLKVETIDLLQLHNPTTDVSCVEMLDALAMLKKEGKIRYYGVCNYALEDMEKIVACANQNNFSPPLSNQFEYNLLNRQTKDLLFDFAAVSETATLTWGPLSGGLLSDWYAQKKQMKPGSRLDSGREKSSKSALLNDDSTRAVLDELYVLSQKSGLSAQVLALHWLIKKRPDNRVLIGPSTLAQLNDLTTLPTFNHNDLSDLTAAF